MAVQLVNFSKRYIPSWWDRKVWKKETVVAVQDLTANIRIGQITALLGSMFVLSYTGIQMLTLYR